MPDRQLNAERLLQSSVFPHEVWDVEVLETHISWVVLTGPFAYKIKKPVKFDFVDYSTLERRLAFCEKELELNRRYAPDLYLGVVPIFESAGKLVFAATPLRPAVPKVRAQVAIETDDSADPVEFAVKMKQFSQGTIVAARLGQVELTGNPVEQFGVDVAGFHDSIECAVPVLDSVQPEVLLEHAMDNFALLQSEFEDAGKQAMLSDLRQWTVEQYHNLKPFFESRLKAGKVRRCHGDLHLKNIIQVNGRLVPFDGIEFNERLQWIDVIGEIAFPVMDFVARGRADLGWRLLTSYLETTGDYDGLRVLRFYMVYLAMVRAKVTWLNPRNRMKAANAENLEDAARPDTFAGPWDKYLATARFLAFDLKPSLSITHGFSGSGKSTRAMESVARTGGVRIRSDVERHRLARKLNVQDEYAAEMGNRVYTRLAEMASIAIESGLPVVIDATFLQRKRRAIFETLAAQMKVSYAIIACVAPVAELRRRIENRGPDPSEATVDVLKLQLENHDPLTAAELRFVSKRTS